MNPPNIREVEACDVCKHGDYGECERCIWCRKHRAMGWSYNICDDFKREE